MNEISPYRGPRSKAAVLLAVTAVIALVAGYRYFHAGALVEGALAWVSGLGAWGAVIFVLVYIVACVLFAPGSALTLGAGFIFGVVEGTALVSVGATLGATCSFLVGRHLARGWVYRKIQGNPTFAAIDEAVGREGWKIVGLTRLSPVFPFNLLNYAFGLTRVSLRDYFFASWIGMLPGTVMYVYIGSLAADLAAAGAGAGGRTRTKAEWALYVVGFLATVALTAYLTRIARKALKGRV